MQINLRDELPFISAKIENDGQTIIIPNVLIDTGSATSMFSADLLAEVGIHPQPDDTLHTVRGVGGIEVVFLRRVDKLIIGEKTIHGFEIEVGGMDYGFAVDGILGMNFLMPFGAVIDLKSLTIEVI